MQKGYACDFHELFSKENLSESSDLVKSNVNNSITNFQLYNCRKTNLPQDILSQLNLLHTLSLWYCDISSFPIIFCKYIYLQELFLTGIPISTLPDEFENLESLINLQIDENVFKEFPTVVFRLKNLKVLHFNAFAFLPERVSSIPVKRLKEQHKNSWAHLKHIGFDEKALDDLINETAIQNKDLLSNQDEIGNFCSGLYFKIPRLSKINFSSCEFLHICENLTVLILKNQAFEILDSSIEYLHNLNHLDVSANYILEEISAKICSLPLRILNLSKCPALKTPPKEIINKGLTAILGYMKRLLEGSTECRRTKLMMVGLGGAGKTTLSQRMMSNDKEEKITTSVTDGITINKWLIKSVEYSIWDFAGQTVYYNTHQFFLSNRAVYLLLWNVRLGHQHAGLEFWLSSIECHAPKAPIFLVGTHIDEVR